MIDILVPQRPRWEPSPEAPASWDKKKGDTNRSQSIPVLFSLHWALLHYLHHCGMDRTIRKTGTHTDLT